MSHIRRRSIAIFCCCAIPVLGVVAAKGQDPELVLQIGNVPSNQIMFCGDGSTFLTSDYRYTILWDKVSGRQLRWYAGHTNHVQAAAVSADGRRIITGSEDETAIVWDRVTGRRIKTFRIEKYTGVTAVALSRDGRLAATGSRKGKLIVWDVETGRRHTTFAGHGDRIEDVMFSLDGSRLLSAADDRTAILWNVGTGRLVRKLQSEHEIRSVAISPDGSLAVFGTGTYDFDSSRFIDSSGTLILWELTNGKRFSSASIGNYVGPVEFAPNGTQLLCVTSVEVAGESRHQLQLRDVKTLALLKTFEHPEDQKWQPGLATFSPDGTEVLTTGSPILLWNLDTAQPVNTYESRTVSVIHNAQFIPHTNKALVGRFPPMLWDLSTGRKLREFAPPFSEFSLDEPTISADGTVVVTIATRSGDNRSYLVVWDAKTGRQVQLFEASPEYISTLAVEQHGTRAVTASNDVATLWDLRTGTKLRQWGKAEHGKYGPLLAAISPDGRRVFTNAIGKGVTLWDAETGREIRTIRRPDWASGIQAVAISPSGRLILATVSGMTSANGKYQHFNACVVWEADTGRRVASWRHANDNEGSSPKVAFSPDGRYALSDSETVGTRVVDVRTGKTVRVIKAGSRSDRHPQIFSGDSRFICSLSNDGTLRLIEIATGREAVRFIQMDEGKNWLAVTPRGLFDGSTAARQSVAFRIGTGLNVVPVDRFFQDFYHPGLLATIWRGERPTPQTRFAAQQAPAVRISTPTSGGTVESQQVSIRVEVTDQGGGIKGPWLLHNGARVLSPGENQQSGKLLKRTFTVALVEGQNEIEVFAASKDGSWESEPARVNLRYTQPLARPALHLVAVGINEYAETTMNLKFAQADAKAIGALFTSRGPALYGEGKVHVTEIANDQATKAGIEQALDQVAAKAKPQDTLVLFLAGHGTTLGQRYYFIPHEFQNKSDRYEEDIRQQGLPSDVLGDMLAKVPALKRVVIFDTCQSGGALALRTTRDPFAFRGALERLSRAQGVFTIAASAASAEAQEVPDLKHGVLTYALLAAMGAVEQGPLATRGMKPKNDNKVAHIRDWFSFAQDNVPLLTKLYFNEEQFVGFTGQGESFPILPLDE